MEVVRSITILAIFIACLGFFGLASFTVVLANLIAWPTAYFFVKYWLGNFAYRIEIGFETFILATVLALIIAVFTVSFQAVKAAVANPVESLRYE